jgi:hypothetical protein
MCHGMEFGWICPRCWVGKGVGSLERNWTMSGMEFWFGKSDRREQVREEIIWSVSSGTESRLLDSKTRS